MAIYNVTTHRHGGTPEVHGVDAESVEIGQESANGDRDSTLRFTDVNGDIVAAFYDWDWFWKAGVINDEAVNRNYTPAGQKKIVE